MNITQRRAPDRRRKLQAIWEWVDLGPSMAGGPLSHPERPESANSGHSPSAVFLTAQRLLRTQSRHGFALPNHPIH